MSVLVQVMGGLLALSGFAGLLYGIDLLPTERGVASTIASSTAIAGGAVTFALGVVIQRLDHLGRGALTPARAAQGAVARPPVLVEPQKPELTEPVPVSPVQADALSDDLLKDLPQPEPVRPAAVKSPQEAESRPVVPFQVPEPPHEAKPEPPATVTAPSRETLRFKLPGLGKRAAATGAAVAATTAAVVAITGGKASAEGESPPALPEPADSAEAQPQVPVEVDEAPPVAEALPDFPEPAPEPEKSVSPPMRSGSASSMPPDPMAELEAELDRLIPLKPLLRPTPSEPYFEATLEPSKGEIAAITATQHVPSEPEPVAVEEEIVALVQPDGENELPLSETTEDGTAEAAAQAAPERPGERVTPEHGTPASSADWADVVGSYESGGARYTMFSNGAVIVETDGRSLTFASLEELREFIDAGVKP